MSLIDKKSFEIMLEDTPRIKNPKRILEQYETPPSIASIILWEAYMRGDITGKNIADLGCGGLRLSIGAYILGATRIIAVDIDEELLTIDEEYLTSKGLDHVINLVLADVRSIYLENIDVVVMNPPFGVVKSNRGIDLVFLKKALEIAGRSVYTIHKWSGGLEKLVSEIANSFGFIIIHRKILNYPLPAIFETHRRKVYRFKTVFYILRRIKKRG